MLGRNIGGVLGYAFGMYVLYAIIAKFSKHQTGYNVVLWLGIILTLVNGLAKGDYSAWLPTLIFGLAVAYIPGIQINNKDS